MSQPLVVLFITILVAYLFGELCKAIRVPRVVGYLMAGIILGLPQFKNAIYTPESLEIINLLADLGIILLFFFIGLGINLKDFKINLKESSLISVFNTLIPLTIGFIVSYFAFNFSFVVSVIIGLALAVSSQIISLDILDEFNLIKTRIGQLIITSGAVDDVFELILITIILALINFQNNSESIFQIISNIAVFIVALILLRLIVFPYVLKFFEKKSKTSLFSAALIIAFLTAILSNLLGLGIFVGALFAGIVIRHILLTGKHRKPWEEHSITDSIHVVAFGLLVPLFFISVGLNTSLDLIFNNFGLGLVFIIIALFGTVLGSVFGVILSKGSVREGLIVGFGVTPKGDTEIILATLALEAGLFTQTIFSSIIFMAIVTTLISPIVFRYLTKKYYYILNKKV